MIGSGKDALPVAFGGSSKIVSALDPNMVALMIFEAALLPTCRPPCSWSKSGPSGAAHRSLFERARITGSMVRGWPIRVRNLLESG